MTTRSVTIEQEHEAKMRQREVCRGGERVWQKASMVSLFLLYQVACVGEIEQTGAPIGQDMTSVVQTDMGGVEGDMRTTPPLPMTGQAMAYSSFHEEAMMRSGRSLLLEPGEALRGVIDLSQYAVVFATDRGLYSWQDDGSRRELVKGSIDAIIKYDEQSVLYLSGGEVFRFDGGQPEVVLGGLDGVDSVEDPVLSIFRSGRDVWFFSKKSSWHMSQDPLQGTHLERLDAFEPRPDALWGTLNATTSYYRSNQQPEALFKLERDASTGAVTLERVRGEGMDLVEAIYPLRGHRHLAIIQGLLAEQIEGVWWWRHTDLEGSAERAKLEVLAHGYDPLASASWLLTRASDAEDPAEVTLHRVESSWAIRAMLPEEHAETILEALAANQLTLHPQSTPTTFFFSIDKEPTRLIELTHEKFVKPALLDPPRGEVTYDEHVRPVAEIFCQECHTNGQGSAIFKIDGYEAWSNPTQFDIFLGSIERGSMPKEDEAVPPFSDELRDAFVESLKQWKAGGFKP